MDCSKFHVALLEGAMPLESSMRQAFPINPERPSEMAEEISCLWVDVLRFLEELWRLARDTDIDQRVTRSLFSHILHSDSIGVCGLTTLLCFKEGRTHFGSMNSFNQASSELWRRTSFRADERAWANAGRALVGTKRRVG